MLKWNEIVPVAISIGVIVLVALLEKHSKLVAAVTATMPLTIPLALWIVYSSSQGDRVAVEQFARSLLLGLVPTIAFVVVAWLAARAGLKIAAILGLGYGVWGLTLLVLILLRRILGG